jgi:metal-dependent amidase/aminoacylase/carboxypeptidase family protein
MMSHSGDHTYCNGPTLAMSQATITFRGKSSNAAASPEKGVNELDALIQAFVAVNALTRHVKGGSRIHRIITFDGNQPNIIPGFRKDYWGN